MKGIIYHIWFPKKGDWIKWRLLRIGILPIIVFLLFYSGIAKQNYKIAIILVCFIFPLLGSAVARIREAQTCSIDDDEMEEFSKNKYKSKKIIGIIGLFLPLLSIIVVHFSYKAFWIVLGLLVLFAVHLMLLRSIYSKIFLILSVLYFILYLFFLCIFMQAPYIFFFIFFSLIMLPSSIAETIQNKRIILE
jgi:uncharacterized membrane protein HdeD (DUF308 family)